MTIDQMQVHRGRGRWRHLLWSCLHPGMMHSRILCRTDGCARSRHLIKAQSSLTLSAAYVWGPTVSVLLEEQPCFAVHKHSN